jgi:hypothetical protein
VEKELIRKEKLIRKEELIRVKNQLENINKYLN